MKTENEYRTDLNEAQRHLGELLREREEIEVRIAKQKRRIAALAQLCEDENELDKPLLLELGGMTEACSTVLRASRKEAINVTEILANLKELGFPLDGYKSPVASVTTTVNRLVESGVVKMFRVTGEGRVYKWVGPKYGAPSSLANLMVDADRERTTKKR